MTSTVTNCFPFQQNISNLNSLHGVLPKNICRSLDKCQTPEACCMNDMIHPYWAVQNNICVYYLQGCCKFGKSGPNQCLREHVDWDVICYNVTQQGADMSRDIFMGTHIKFYNPSWHHNEEEAKQQDDLQTINFVPSTAAMYNNMEPVNPYQMPMISNQSNDFFQLVDQNNNGGCLHQPIQAINQDENVENAEIQLQEITQLCDMFLGAGSGLNMISLEQIQEAYYRNDFQTAVSILQQTQNTLSSVDTLQYRDEVAHYYPDVAYYQHDDSWDPSYSETNDSLYSQWPQTVRFVSTKGADTILTPQVVRHFRKKNNQSTTIADKYNEYRIKPLEPHLQAIEDAKLKIFFSYLTRGSHSTDLAVQNFQEVQTQYLEEEAAAEQRILEHLNTEATKNDFIDLHGQQVKKGIEIAMFELERLANDLNQGLIYPTNCNGNHVFKIICGAGSHSKSGVGMLKKKLQEELEAHNYDYHADMNHGVFLVGFAATLT